VIGAGTMGRGMPTPLLSALQHCSGRRFRHVLEEASLDFGQSFEEGVARGKVEAGVRTSPSLIPQQATLKRHPRRRADHRSRPGRTGDELELFTIFDKFAKTGAIFSRATRPLSRLPISPDVTVSPPAAWACIFSIPCENETHRTVRTPPLRMKPWPPAASSSPHGQGSGDRQRGSRFYHHAGQRPDRQ